MFVGLKNLSDEKIELLWLIIDVAMNESSENGVENVERESECEVKRESATCDAIR